jgi:outer membrane immunogenic protein
MSGVSLRVGVSLHQPTVGRASSLRIAIALCSLVVAASADRARAADWPLRGSLTPTYTHWDGYYAGAQGGQSFASADFSNGSSSQINFILANTELQPIVSSWTTLPKGTTGGQSFGGFFGYNVQWENVIMGGELNYNHFSLKNGSENSVGPILVPGANLPDGSTVLYTVTVTSAASLSITDVLTARGRAGWAYDRFLPYAFVGLAVGRFDVTRSVSVTGLKTTQGPPVGGVTPPPSIGTLILPRNPQVEGTEGQIAYGYTAGLGVDISLLPNMFLRAEWEYVQFPNVSDFRVAMNSARLGLGVKF